MARRTLVMRNVREVVEAANGKPILFFPARHDHWLVQTGDGWAAHVAGAIGVSTDAQASWWGGRGVGTVPHALIAAFDGDTVAAARAFAERYSDQMNVTVLVDFENDSVRTSLEVADALGRQALGRAPRHLGVGWWTAPSSHEMGDFEPTGVTPELVTKVRSALDAAGHERRADRGLRRVRCRQDPPLRGARRAGRLLRRRLLPPPRAERLHRRRRARGRAGSCAKAGRRYRPNPRLEAVH